jgi:hypothetical protein
MTMANRTSRSLAAVALFVSMAAVTEAGPPLICHPFETGQAPLLTWGNGAGWNTPSASYDVRRVSRDTLKLLTADAPVLARMENLRRATIYASQNRDVAFELLTAVLGRALTAQSAGSRDPLPLFDAAYVIEAFRQAGTIHKWSRAGADEQWLSKELGELSGYPFMQRALALAGESAEMEFAASLMQRGATAEAHRRRAVAGAARGSLLAKNLERLN